MIIFKSISRVHHALGDDVQQGVNNDTLRFPALVYPNKGLTVVENYITKKVHYYYYSLDSNKAQINAIEWHSKGQK
jgi:hypothetical protein